MLRLPNHARTLESSSSARRGKPSSRWDRKLQLAGWPFKLALQSFRVRNMEFGIMMKLAEPPLRLDTPFCLKRQRAVAGKACGVSIARRNSNPQCATPRVKRSAHLDRVRYTSKN